MTEDEGKEEWGALLRQVRPLKPRRAGKHHTPLKGDAHSSPRRTESVINFNPQPIAPYSGAMFNHLEKGDMSGLDAKISYQITRGKTMPEAILDLHGNTEDRAFELTSRFVINSRASGKRLIMIITGKGEVLREGLPKWLNTSALRSSVQAFCHAPQKLGGVGACLVYLRKR